MRLLINFSGNPLTAPLRLLVLLLSLFSVFFFLPSPALPESPAEWRKVVSVEDGDSITLENGRRVRYLGIDSPERGGPGKGEYLAEEAHRLNRQMVRGQEVRLEYEAERLDRYQRLLARVYLKNGLWVNGEMVKKGLAHVRYQAPNTEKFEELLRVQREAMDDRRGIWIKSLEETDSGYRGQKGTKKFHRRDCSDGQKIAARNLILFKYKKDAYGQGFSPCRICRP
jgi:endonuclease YncB( thermonuclease family)